MIAAIYARKSTEQTIVDEQRSITRQIDHARAYAEGKGWTASDQHVYVDDGISGAEFANRPGFVRLMTALKPRAPFQVLVMSEESRLGREAIETAFALKQFVTAGVRVFFYLEDRERTLDSPTDKIMLSLTTFADELEREKARQRTYDAMQRKAEGGPRDRRPRVRIHESRRPGTGRPTLARRTRYQRGRGGDRTAYLPVVRRGAWPNGHRETIESRAGHFSAFAARPAADLGALKRSRSAAPRAVPRADRLESNAQAERVGAS
jgi:DNA invertase Pin-like site-specific DNA recombinase